MTSLQYRIVTNWPASMQEDFVFAPTEDRNAHYDMVVEILSCIADEDHPEQFRLCEQTTYEYDIKMPVEPSIPRMPTPSGMLDDDAAFVELCQRYISTVDMHFSSAQSTLRDVHIAKTETYALEGRQLAELAELAKRDRPKAKLRFILGKFGITQDDERRMSLERDFRGFARAGEDAKYKAKKTKKDKKKKSKKAKGASKLKKPSIAKKDKKRREAKKAAKGKRK